jgi:hypothetical protein
MWESVYRTDGSIPLKQGAKNMSGLYQPDKSAVAEHSTESGHRIKFHETEVPAKTSRLHGPTCQRSTEIESNPDNIKREKGFKLSKVWNPSTSLLRHSTTHIMKIPSRYREEHAKNRTK